MRLQVRLWTPATVNRLPLRRKFTTYSLLIAGHFWMLMSLAGVCLDCVFGVAYQYPEQIPAYILLWVVCLADTIQWMELCRSSTCETDKAERKMIGKSPDEESYLRVTGRSLRMQEMMDSDIESSSNSEDNNHVRHDDGVADTADDCDEKEYMSMHRYIVVGYLALLFAHVGLGLYYSVLWTTASSSLGINIIKAPVTMSKALGHWITFLCVYLVFPARGVKYEWIATDNDNTTPSQSLEGDHDNRKSKDEMTGA